MEGPYHKPCTSQKDLLLSLAASYRPQAAPTTCPPTCTFCLQLLRLAFPKDNNKHMGAWHMCSLHGLARFGGGEGAKATPVFSTLWFLWMPGKRVGGSLGLPKPRHLEQCSGHTTTLQGCRIWRRTWEVGKALCITCASDQKFNHLAKMSLFLGNVASVHLGPACSSL